MKDAQLINQTEAYLRGEFSPAERAAFELLCKENPDIQQQVNAV